MTSPINYCKIPFETINVNIFLICENGHIIWKQSRERHWQTVSHWLKEPGFEGLEGERLWFSRETVGRPEPEQRCRAHWRLTLEWRENGEGKRRKEGVGEREWEEKEGLQGSGEGRSSVAVPEITLSLETSLIKEGKAHMISQIPIENQLIFKTLWMNDREFSCLAQPLALMPIPRPLQTNRLLSPC